MGEKENPVKEGFNKGVGEIRKKASAIGQGAKALIKKVLTKNKENPFFNGQKEDSDLFSKKVH
jgi:hypothetical protein|tara:strand:- start:563 stop:751 length:189 start_codon:yes stop_codon:yes gene_type:complete